MTGKVTEDTKEKRASPLWEQEVEGWAGSTEIYSKRLHNTQTKTCYQTPGLEPVHILALPLITEIPSASYLAFPALTAAKL